MKSAVTILLVVKECLNMRNSLVLQTTNGRLLYKRVAHAHEKLRKINDINST